MTRILVIDDEAMVRALIVRALSDDGYEVSVAGGGQEAVDLAVRTRFDLVVTNSRLRDMSGDNVVTELRRHFPGIPILHVDDLPQSTRSSPGLAERVPVIYKPFSIGALLAAVRKLVKADAG